MEVYRLAHSDFAKLDGKGGLFGSGRWHCQGMLCTYAGSSRALAVLERFIHDANALLVPDLKMITIYIPDEMAFEQCFENELSEGWDTTESLEQDITQNIGSAFLQSQSHAYMKVPSAIIPHEFNYLLNPLHPEASRIKVIDSHKYQYDPRYKRMIRSGR